jgi:hypothetical protein
VGNATRIGHDCREAMIAFASSLADRYKVAAATRPEQTVDKIRAVIDLQRGALGSKTGAFLDAGLVMYEIDASMR